ncbi:hypothetical protein C9374_004767 [Naegleria lovaniensis]|uniref:Uncharacterized protein n=1 Tax=Naegleria lovaniensis TaxID=51637 RepID=A0AA88GRK1_NAELO|nr:uncharacterized protein C9374_004767 [Naegleria lovaniensis]KAG2382800.1 hypothetical protein C9374_004767 [Naegleria lovaniensis]
MNVPHVSSTTSPKASLPTTATTTASKFQEENSEQQLPSDKPLASHPYFTNHPRLAQQPQHQQTRTKSPHNTRNNSTAVTTMSNKPKSMNHQKPTPTTTLHN